MYPSDIRKKLATGKPVLSTSMPSFEPHIANATYNCKPDWVWIDTEHNPWGTESMGTLCVDGRKKGVAPVIRIPWNDPAYIKKAYDVGAVFNPMLRLFFSHTFPHQRRLQFKAFGCYS